MVRARLDEAVEAMQGTLVSGDGSAYWSGAVLDSRKVEGGELFFAIRGERTDGHLFVSTALERGASAAVVSRDVESGVTGLIEVDDTLSSLHALTRRVRERVPENLVGITGSVGKTTTKEMLSFLLSTRFRVARNPGNLNNLYGFPIALLGVPDDTEWMVAEMGMSTPGELARISRLGRPNLVVITNVRPVHLESFGSLRAVAEAKAEILEGLEPGGSVIANADDPEVVRIVRKSNVPVVWFGLDSSADISASQIRPPSDADEGLHFLLRVESREVPVELPLYGAYNVENFLAAAAAAHAIGLTCEEIVAGAKLIESAAMRGVVHRIAGDGVLIDDSYNSNPWALKRALESAAAIRGARHWAVLGDMLELGPEAADFHRLAGEGAVARGFGPVIGVGPLARGLVAAVEASGGEGEWFAAAAEAAEGVRDRMRPGDVILVKGSRGIGLEVVVDALLGREVVA